MSVAGRTLTLSLWPRSRRRRALAADRVILAAQAVAVLIVVLYEASELAGLPWPLESQEFAPIALFLIPMLYVIRGLRPAVGAAAIAWSLTLVVLDVALERHGLGRLADGLQVAIVGTVAIFVGARVQHEQRVRRQAEETREALRVSEARYRALFEQSQTAALVVQADGVVREANAAATALFGGPVSAIVGRPLSELVGPAARDLLGGKPPSTLERPTDAGVLVLRPLCTAIRAGTGTAGWQIVLPDITEERRLRQRADAYAAHVLRGQEDERRRIAHELHDDPVQSLIHICRRLDGLPQRGALPADTVTALDATRRLTEQTVQGLRELAHGLRPPSLDDLGLAASLRQHFRQFEARTGVEATLDILGAERRLGADAELALFRIAQEALRNVERHAAARRVSARLVFGHAVRLSVRDDGIGFTVPSAAEGVGMNLGLLGMQERAALVGGRLRVRSAEGAGTLIHVLIPEPADRWVRRLSPGLNAGAARP